MEQRSPARRWVSVVGLVVAALAMLGAEVLLPVGPVGAASAASDDPAPTPAPQPNIVGGTVAPAGAWPAQVALVRAGRTASDGIFCGGTVIARTWVLTAAHCVDGGTRPSDLVVVVGTQDLRIGGTRIPPVQLVVHPYWTPSNGRNDIALIRLDHPVPPSLPVQPLTATGVSPAAGTDVTVTGWGVTAEGSRQPVAQLRQVTLDVSTPQACAAGDGASYHQPTMVCAARAGKDSCQGDSGGPLLEAREGTWVQVGIVSRGEGCARPGFPGVYTKLSAFRDWVGNRLRFGAHPDAASLVSRTYLDAFGRPPTGSEAYFAVATLDGGTTPSRWAADLMQGEAFDDRTGAVVRLYQAVFLRRPDTGGLSYWWQRVTGGTSVSRIADQMVAAPEFRQRYGPLSNGGFVDLVYDNVLGRAPSPADRAYWVGELDSGRRTRGRVMVGFSESGEYRNATSGATFVVGAFFTLVRRVPTAAEVAEWERLATWEPLVRMLLDSYGYAARL